MRIEFVNIERPGVKWSQRELCIGSAADNDLVLDGQGIAAHHVQLTHDVRGLVLTVQPGAGRVYLNARQVRERALLRAGDSLGIGGVRLRICKPASLAAPGNIGQASLRAVGGPLSGRAQGIGKRLDLGNRGRWPLGLGQVPDSCLSLLRDADDLRLRSLQWPDNCKLSVNGMVTRERLLHDGDQIAIGPHRFVLDACMLSLGDESAEKLDEGMLREDSAGPRREVWWLIFTAATLALIIALLLLVRL